MARGGFCASIDVELAWGISDKPSDDYFYFAAWRRRDLMTMFGCAVPA